MNNKNRNQIKMCIDSGATMSAPTARGVRSLSKNPLIMAKVLLSSPRRTACNSCTQKRNGNQTVSKLHLSKIVFAYFYSMFS